jgi:hypothetical protein
MRSVVAIIASVAMLVGQVPLVPAFGQSASPAPQASMANPVMAETFKAFPSGGDPLTRRIADLITANPKLAPEFVIYMRNAKDLSKAQTTAAEQGIAAAADRLGIKGQVPGFQNDPWFALAALLAVAGTAAMAYGLSQANNNNNGAVFVNPVVSPH